VKNTGQPHSLLNWSRLDGWVGRQDEGYMNTKDPISKLATPIKI